MEQGTPIRVCPGLVLEHLSVDVERGIRVKVRLVHLFGA